MDAGLTSLPRAHHAVLLALEERTHSEMGKLMDDKSSKQGLGVEDEVNVFKFIQRQKYQVGIELLSHRVGALGEFELRNRPLSNLGDHSLDVLD